MKADPQLSLFPLKSPARPAAATVSPRIPEYARLVAVTPAADFLEIDPFRPGPFDFEASADAWANTPGGAMQAEQFLPGEEGYVELDRFGRVKGAKS